MTRNSPFRAAYIADDGSSTSGGLLLTDRSQSTLTDAELLRAAIDEARNIGLDVDASDISIGEWQD